MDEYKSLEIVEQLIKHLVTLVVALLGFTITFHEKIIGANACNKELMIASWIGFMLSLLGATLSYQTIASYYATRTTNIYSEPLRFLMRVAVYGFWLGLIYLVLYGVINVVKYEYTLLGSVILLITISFTVGLVCFLFKADPTGNSERPRS